MGLMKIGQNGFTGWLLQFQTLEFAALYAIMKINVIITFILMTIVIWEILLPQEILTKQMEQLLSLNMVK